MGVRRASFWIVSVASVLLVAALATAAATSTTFMVTRGASMQPALSAGDLAILGPAEEYRVGDIAAYRNQALNRLVLHRIAGVDGDVVTFKGDANAFLDPERVRREDVVGRLAIRVPALGSALQWLVHPLSLLLLVAVIAALAWRRRAPQASALDTARLLPVHDLAFPHELAIADVADLSALIALAERHDRPVLHDAAHASYYVVEGSMLFRCRPASRPALHLVADAPAAQAWERKDGRRPTPRGPSWDYRQRDTS